MGLYLPVAGDKITAARWKTYYDLLKGVAGGEDAVRLAHNVNDTLVLQPTADPASVVDLFRVKTQAGVEKFALRSDGALCLADQAAEVGSLENGLLWRNGAKFYGRLGGTTVELFTAVGSITRRVRLGANLWNLYSGTPALVSAGTLRCWSFDPGTDEEIHTDWEVPIDWVSGTITAKVRWANINGSAGLNVRWQLQYKSIVKDTGDTGAAFTTLTQLAAAPTQYRWTTTTLGTLTVAAGDELVLVLRRDADHADDNYPQDAFAMAVDLEYTAST